MFGDIFESGEDIEWSAQAGTLLTYEQRKPKNCAHFLDLPALGREKNTFCGLKNQGATCYLNSLIQLCYMSPEFRNTILRLPLCKDTIDEPTEFVSSKTTKHKILFGLQKLFSEMQELDVRSVSTEKVTDSFGWNDNQAMMQQDIQEANRVIFDVIDRALFGTTFSDGISKYYKGIFVNHLECLNCGLIKEREESFYDLIMQVKGFSSIEESLLNMLTFEKLEGSNQYFCETCNKKVDAYKGIKIRKFPPILTLSLSRFEYDYMKGEMKKINDALEFGLELDISVFAEKPEEYTNENDRIYELAGVLIHRGDPYGGHYHAYIRDQLSEGEWKAKFAEVLSQKEKRKKEKEAEAEKALQQATEVKADQTQTTENKNEDGKVKEGSNDQSEQNIADEKDKGEEKDKKKNKKNKDKGNKRKRNDGEETAESQNEKPNKKEEEKKKEIYDDTVFDETDFPIAFSNKDLTSNWFDFNDSSVTAIPVNRLQTQFGGRGSENAYILLYRQKSLAQDPSFKKLELQSYLKKSVESQNKAVEDERKIYAEAETQLEMIFLESKSINLSERKFIQPIDPTKDGNKLRFSFESTIKEVFDQLNFEDPENYVLAEMQTLPNGLIQFKRVIDCSFSDQKISELNIECWSTWIPFRNDDDLLFDKVAPYCGNDFVPIRVNIRNPQSKDTLIITFQNKLLRDFQKQVEEVSEIPADHQILLLMEGEFPKVINNKEEDYSAEIRTLGICDNTDVMVDKIDPEELKKQREIQEAKQKDLEAKKDEKDVSLSTKTENLTSVLVERDDEDGVVKYYVDLDWSLDELIENIKKKLGIQAESERRLRKLNDKAVFYEEDLPLKLRNLNFEEGGIRLRLERGKTPQLGNLSIRIRNQSKLKKDTDPENLDLIALPSETLAELKKKACIELSLEVNDHKLYQTDWLEEPVQLFNKEDRLLREAGIKQGELIVLRDKDNPIPKEVLKIDIHVTKTGFHDDSEYLGILQAREEQTFLDLKNMIAQMPYFTDKNIDVNCLRVRERRKDTFFGKIYRGDSKSLKKLGIETNCPVVIQILDKSEILTENTLVLFLRKRIVESQTYTRGEEFIWEASKEPTIEELKKAILEFKKIQGGLDSVELAKYVPHEFHWLPVNQEVIEKERNAKKGKKNPKGNNKGNKKGTPAVENTTPQQAENLRKAPYLLHDGDLIAYRLEEENLEKKDDFQTKEDEENHKKFLEDKKRLDSEKTSTRKNRNVGGFQIYTDF